MNVEFESLMTEQRNDKTTIIDEVDTVNMLKIINDEDKKVAFAVEQEIDNIAKVIDMVYDRIIKGGRLHYVGAGTSGRLGVLDASECQPTFGTPADLIQGHIAGGDHALRNAIENAEDNKQAGSDLIHDASITSKDVVIGISASGSAPYVYGALEEAQKQGAATASISNNKDPLFGEVSDVVISVLVGPEVITGSTRLKSGTSQKLVLNMITTSVMVKMGKVYGNLMVDVKASNKKLVDRAIRIVSTIAEVDTKTAKNVLEKSDMNVKTAIFMIKSGADKDNAQKYLKDNNDRLKDALKAFGG